MAQADRDWDAMGCALCLLIAGHARINRLLVLADTLRWQMHSLEKDAYATRSAWDEACATAGITPDDLKPYNDIFGTPEAPTQTRLMALYEWLGEYPIGELVSLVEGEEHRWTFGSWKHRRNASRARLNGSPTR